MREGYKTHVAEAKKAAVQEYEQLIGGSPIVGVVNLENLPTAQLNNMRKQLRGSGVTIKMGKKRIINRAIENVKAKKTGIEKLEEQMKGMPALLFTETNPFALFKLIKKNKSPAAAKAGQTAPNDIEVKAGMTQFAPGPIISELGNIGIKTKVTDGKLEITEDVVIAKEGDVIDDNMASMLQRLDIKPMEIGLDLVAIYENGMIYSKSVLDIDEDQFMADLDNCARWAFNLAVDAGYPTKETTELFVVKSAQEAKALALEASILTKDTVADVLGKAHNQMMSVKGTLGV